MTHIQEAIIELSFLVEGISSTYETKNSHNSKSFSELVNSAIKINTHLNNAYCVEKNKIQDEHEIIDF